MKGIRKIICLVIVAISGVTAVNGQIIELNRCKQTVTACRMTTPTYEQYTYMLSQCRTFVDRYLQEVRKIKLINTLDNRKQEAENFSRNVGDEYEVYCSMLKIIKSAMDGQDANLGRLNTYEAEHLINDDKYVNQMFVIYNGSYEFR
jgi:hypothetical protein